MHKHTHKRARPPPPQTHTHRHTYTHTHTHIHTHSHSWQSLSMGGGHGGRARGEGRTGHICEAASDLCLSASTASSSALFGPDGCQSSTESFFSFFCEGTLCRPMVKLIQLCSCLIIAKPKHILGCGQIQDACNKRMTQSFGLSEMQCAVCLTFLHFLAQSQPVYTKSAAQH